MKKGKKFEHDEQRYIQRMSATTSAQKELEL